MIRLLQEDDTHDLLDFLYQESAFNIFPIGDVETFGIHTDFLHVYGDYVKGTLESILLIYHQNAIYYSIVETINPDFIPIVSLYNVHVISGKESLMSRWIPYIPSKTIKTMCFCRLRESTPFEDHHFSIHRLSTEEEAKELFDLLKRIDEFADLKTDKEAFVQEKMHALKMGMTLTIRENNHLVATASTTATTSKSTMIVGVATDKDYRRKGYATALLMEIIKHYVDEKKECCLFFDNLEAGRIYERLGFRIIGRWMMIQR